MSAFFGNLWGGFGSFWGSWFGNVAVPDPHPAPKDPAKVEAQDPIDRTQAFSVVTAMGHLPGFDAAPPPSDFVRWQMRRFHTIALAHAVVTAPILAGKQTIVIRNDRGNKALAEKIQKDAETVFLPRVMDWLPGALESLHFGHWLQEVVWDVVDGSVVPVAFRPLLPGEYIPYKDAHGQFSGYQYRQDYRDKRYAFLSVEGEQIDPIFGWSRNDNVREEWWRIRQSEVNADRTERKASGNQMGVGLPTGASFVDDNGKPLFPQNLVQSIVDAQAQGQTFQYPTFFFDKKTIKDKPELAAISPIKLDMFDWGNTGPAIMAHLARVSSLEVKIMRGWRRPEREAMAGKAGGGTNAESETQGEIGTTDSELVGQSIFRQFSRQVLNTWAVNKYGPDAADVVAMEMAPLSDPQQQYKQKMCITLAQDTNTGQETQAHIDQRKLLEETEVPLVPEDEANAKIAQLQAEKDQKAQQQQQAMQAGAMNGDGQNGVPVNGNGQKNGKAKLGPVAKRLLGRMG